ncbi:MAG TPA: hypothetical protein VHS58_13325 [Acetobacteraceae bacterium]|jgi:hypothetical protein|nr:hypothetical protein [Acetobacteraceae bacterium]
MSLTTFVSMAALAYAAELDGLTVRGPAIGVGPRRRTLDQGRWIGQANPFQ